MEPRYNKSYSFITLYLMGLERHVLEKEFFEDYTYSCGLTSLESVKDAKLIRYASRIRQKVYRNYDQHRSATDFVQLAEEYFKTEFDYLKEQGVDLGQSFRESNSIVSVVNALTHVISTKLPEVLYELNFPHIECVESAFYMFHVTDKSLDKYVKTMQPYRLKFPYKLFITRHQRLKTYLSSFFGSDKIFFIGCHNLSEMQYNETIMQYTNFEWNSISKDELPKLPIHGSSHFYVDCDNVGYFTFIGLLESLKQTSKPYDKHIFNLYVDDATSPLWKVTSHLEHPLFQFDIIEVERVKAMKSVVDIVMVSHISQNSMKEDSLPPIVVSSDSDYIGLLHAGVTLGGVLYEARNTNNDYITQLKKQRVNHFNIGSLSNEKFRQLHENNIIRQIVLDTLPLIPMVDWTVEHLTDVVLSKQAGLMDFEMGLLEHNVVYQVNNLLPEINVVFVNGAMKVTIKETADVTETPSLV